MTGSLFPLALAGLITVLMGAPGDRSAARATAASGQTIVSLDTAVAAGVPVRLIKVNLSSPQVTVSAEVSAEFPDRAEDFHRMMARLRPAAAINGGYFTAPDGPPIGIIVIGGRLVWPGDMPGTALAITRDKKAIIRRIRDLPRPLEQFDTVIGCGPALVLDGKPDVHPDIEHFTDSNILGSTRRVGVGLTSKGDLVLVQTLASVTFPRFAEVMVGLGCTEAMNLDAGGSTAMAYNGAVLNSGRRLNNILAVYTSRRPRAAAFASAPSLPGAPIPASGGAPPPVSVGGNRIRVCADSGQRAGYYCPTTVERLIPRSARLKQCPTHREPR